MSELAGMIVSAQCRSGLTETEISKKYGFSQQTFSTWKRGVIPRPSMHSKIAKFLGITPEDVSIIVESGQPRDCLSDLQKIVGSFAPALLRELDRYGWKIVRKGAA